MGQDSREIPRRISEGVESSLKSFLRRNRILWNLSGCPYRAPRWDKAVRRILREIGDKGVALDLGSGNRRWASNVVNLDIEPFPNVDVIGDGAMLPFKDESFDAVISEAVLEHVPDPKAVIYEIRRVLKPGGYICVAVPFIQGYHASPNDYQRYTVTGLERLLSDFRRIESGPCVGPASALHWVMRELVGIALSFGNFWIGKAISLIFGWITFPMVIILDPILIRLPNSHLIASAVYFIGRKEDQPTEV